MIAVEPVMRDAVNRQALREALVAASSWDAFRLQYLQLLEVRAEMQLAGIRLALQNVERQIETKAAARLAEQARARLAEGAS